MKIYTRTGDAGLTGLYGGGRVRKNDLRIAAYGAIDELNAQLGVCRTAELPPALDEPLVRLQHEMFALGAELSSPDDAAPGSILIDDADVAAAEQAIDWFEQHLQPLKTFILPGGTPASAALHVARAVCRRAERDVCALAEAAPVRTAVLQYLNRVGDLLFVLARYANHAVSAADVLWEKKQ
jgi:cob(I)alamin adenosyltransferase